MGHDMNEEMVSISVDMASVSQEAEELAGISAQLTQYTNNYLTSSRNLDTIREHKSAPNSKLSTTFFYRPRGLDTRSVTIEFTQQEYDQIVSAILDVAAKRLVGIHKLIAATSAKLKDRTET